MTKIGAVALVGKSGHHYEFNIYPMTVKLKPGHGGVYAVSARSDEDHAHHKHHTIFIGEAADLGEALTNHPKQAAFEEHSANCICVHASNDTQARSKVLADLLAHYSPPAND